MSFFFSTTTTTSLTASTDPRPRTHNALNDFYQAQFRDAIQRGDLEPFVWPYRSFGVFVLLAYLLLVPPNTKSRIVQYAFYPVFAFFCWWSVRAIFETKSASLVVSYLIGVGNTWGVMWVAARMLFRDYRLARRVEWRDAGLHGRGEEATDGGGGAVTITTAREQNGAVKTAVAGISKDAPGTGNLERVFREYYWQTLPSLFSERVDFIVDLLFSMRGPGWEHQARSIPGPPKSIASKLHPAPPSVKPAVKGYADRKSLLWANGIRFVRYMIYLDVIKTMMTHDQYFLGFFDPPPPAPSFLPTLVRQSPILTRCYRLILSMCATRTTLGLIFCLSPIFFSGILGSKIMGLRAEPWYYSDFNGDWRYILSDGIAGWWGAWWHQIFRLGFEAPSKWACEKLNISPRSPPGKVLGLFAAFFCSGLLHALASINMIPETNPWSGPLLFFLLQAFGIIIESAASQALRKAGVTQRMPVFIQKTVLVIWLATWAYYTGPFIVEDFARGGTWLFEPVPFSVLKMLGFGEPNDHWWRWRGRNVFWYSGDRWWKSGLAI